MDDGTLQYELSNRSDILSAMSELQHFVKKLLEKYPAITCRKAYGQDAFYVKEKIFVVIAADDLIAIKVDDFEARKKILAITDIKRWSMNGKPIENWFLLPTTFNKKKNRLAPVLDMTYKAILNPKKQKSTNKKKKRSLTPLRVDKQIENNVENRLSKVVKRFYSFLNIINLRSKDIK